MNNSTLQTRPGVYVKYRGVPKTSIYENGRGVVLMPLCLDYGPTHTFITITQDTNLFELFGRQMSYDLVNSESTEGLYALGEALKKAHTVIVYRLNQSERARAQAEGFTVKAKYCGARGNSFAIKVAKLAVDQREYAVETFVEGVLVNKQIVKNVDELDDNAFVTFSEKESLEALPLTNLSDGSDEVYNDIILADFLAGAAKLEYNTLCCASEEIRLKEVLSEFVRRERELEGKFVTCIMPSYDADYEGIISVRNGVVNQAGHNVGRHIATAFVAGATAAAADNESLTYSKYPGAIDVYDDIPPFEIREELKKGSFIFSKINGEILIERDINSLVTFSPTHPEFFSKNRVIRVIDVISNDIKTMCRRLIIGKLPNNDDGRGILKSSIVSYLQGKVGRGSIADLDVNSDVKVSEGERSDAINIEIGVRPIDAVEKIFMTLSVE